MTLVVVGMLVGLAPLLHAICVVPSAQTGESSVSHVMADGTIMGIATLAPEKTDGVHAAVQSAVQADGLGAMIGGIVLVAGLTILSVLSVRFCRSRAALGESRPPPRLRRILLVPALARPPTDIDLLTLGISRT